MTYGCGTWLNKLNVFTTVHCFDNSEYIAVSMATYVTAHDVHVTQRNALPFAIFAAQIYTSRKRRSSCLH